VKESSRPTAVECLQHPWIDKRQRSNLSAYDLEVMAEAVFAWRNRTPMQQALCLWMVAGPAGAACHKKFSTLFSQLDVNNCGVLTHDNVFEGLQSLDLAVDIDLSTLRKVAQALDVNKDGLCEYLEFSAGCLSSLEEGYDEMLCQHFAILDVEGKGCLSKEGLDLLVGILKPLISNMNVIVRELHKIQDSAGVITMLAFCKYFGRDGVDYDAVMKKRDPTIDEEAKKKAISKKKAIDEEAKKKENGSSPTKRPSSRPKVQPKTMAQPLLTRSASPNVSDKENGTSKWSLPSEVTPPELDKGSGANSAAAFVPCTPSKPSFIVSL